MRARQARCATTSVGAAAPSARRPALARQLAPAPHAAAARGNADSAPPPPPRRGQPSPPSLHEQQQLQAPAPPSRASPQQRRRQRQQQQHEQQQQEQQLQQQRQRQQQQQQSPPLVLERGSGYQYDATRWWVRSADWQHGAPPSARRAAPTDYLVVGPRAAPHRHAAYMMGRLLQAGKGRIELLFHGPHGAAKALAVLHAATLQLQRRHGCSVLAQVGGTPHAPYRLKLLARLWPFAGVVTPQPLAGAEGDGSGGGADGGGSAAAAAGAAADTTGRPASRGPGWLRRSLVSRPAPGLALPACVRHLPPLALPAVVSRHRMLSSSRHTAPAALARSIAAHIAQRGRCRLRAAGGLAVQNALVAVGLADVALARTHGMGLVVHVEAVKQRAPLAGAAPGAVAGGRAWAGGVPAEQQQQQQQAEQQPEQEQEQQEEQQPSHTVRYYSLTLIAANRDADATPRTCVMVPRRQRQQRQQGSGAREVPAGEQGQRGADSDAPHAG